jgi:hypothetical protein
MIPSDLVNVVVAVIERGPIEEVNHRVLAVLHNLSQLHEGLIHIRVEEILTQPHVVAIHHFVDQSAFAYLGQNVVRFFQEHVIWRHLNHLLQAIYRIRQRTAEIQKKKKNFIQIEIRLLDTLLRKVLNYKIIHSPLN